MTVVVGGIALHGSVSLLGERQAPKKTANVVYGYHGGATLQTAPGITSGSRLQLEAKETENGVRGYFTWDQIRQLRDLEALGLPVTLTFYGRSYQVLMVTDWSTFVPVRDRRNEPKNNDDIYVGLLTMYRTTG